nr:MAG TPA: hypothetical protein [Caudoviricetes sp.]
MVHSLSIIAYPFVCTRQSKRATRLHPHIRSNPVF